jgi:hypothetical protein
VGHFSLKTEHDSGLDITFIYPVGYLEDEVDCIAMYEAWVDLHAKQVPRSYSIAVMDMFSVAPQAMALYLEYVGRISVHNRGVCVVVDFSAADSRAVADNIDTMNGDVLFAPNIDAGVALLNKVRASRVKEPRRVSRLLCANQHSI